MPSKTDKNLAEAFAAESKVAARNTVFALKAEREGFSQFARLFRAVAEAQSVHARRYLRLMRGKIGSTEENLESAFQKEIVANVLRYPRLIEEAAEEGTGVVAHAFSQSERVERRHAEIYRRAREDMLADRQTVYYVCQVCGNISENAPPDNCPICGAVKDKFKKLP